MNIAIVIPCYKRTRPLEALLASLNAAAYDDDRPDLVFSIDRSDSDEAAHTAEGFVWRHGEKHIIRHERNIGLRNNILFCGDLTQEYDAVIVIEDDLLVSRSYYRYARSAAEFYRNEDRIAGISLYQYELEEITWSRFMPVYEGFDTYFIAWASSWGQLWTRRQWEGFRRWYDTEPDIMPLPLPACVKRWRHSWKKYYAAYLTATDRYFVFPFQSHIHNGSLAEGVHSYRMPCTVTASQFNYYEQRVFRFPALTETRFRYDAYFQLDRRTIGIGARDYDVQFDLFGSRMEVEAPYVVTSRNVSDTKTIASFDADMLPLELNILENRPGNVFRLIRREDFNPASGIEPRRLPHFRRVLEWRAMLLCAASLIREKARDKAAKMRHRK